MSSQDDMRNNEVTKKTNQNSMNKPNEPFDKQDPNQPVEAGEENLERTQNNQKDSAEGNNPKSKTGPAENLRSKAANAEDKSQDSREPA